MDYEKKYKGLVGKIEKAYLYAQTDSTKAVLEEIHPALKESEDERIRKEIMEYVKNTPVAPEGHIEQRVLSRWLAWLEKQGEQKSTIEMKSAEESLGIDSETYNKIVDECIYGEQKPQRMVSAEAKEALYDKPACAWSEEDDVMIKVFDSIIRYIVEVVDKDVLERFGTNREELFSWLKSIKQRIGG